MKKNYSLILIVCLCFVLSGFSQTSDLFISEYAEGSSNNKYVEIYNGTGNPVDLSDYQLWRISNGGNWPGASITLSGTLADGNVYIIANGASSATILAAADLTNGIASWNGNDAVGLAKDIAGTFTLIDAVGTNGPDPGSGWDVAGTTNGTLNHTLVRKSTVCDPTINWTASAGTNTTDSEWNVLAQDDWTNIGAHTESCASCTDALDFANIQSPTTTQTITVGGNFDVFAQCYEPGVTDTPFAQGAGINAWIGYSTTNNNPSSAGWTWVPATYNNIGGINDEYQADIGVAIATPGTYYFASRWELNGCAYTYGGSGGNWNNDSVELIVEPYQVDFCSLQFPGVGTITLGDNFAVYGQVFETGVTPGAGQGAGITAEIGYSTTNTDPSTWTNWIGTAYNPACGDCNGGQNDEYSGDLGLAISTAGTYYYALRYTLNSGPYSYGGILADGSAGNFWDGVTYISGVLTVNNPPPADVVITEIMYNSSGTDDEWIELCNISGSTQVLNGHVIEYEGSPIFTFPSTGVTLADGNCITISFGSNGDGTYNNLCPFTPDFGIGASTNDINNINNTAATISLVAADGTTPIDTVAYSSVDGADGDGGTLHVIDATLDNSVTSTNWWETINGGSPGTNSLISPCTPVGPEINLEGTTANFPDIADGDTTPNIFDGTDFGNVGVGGNSTNTFRIENFGGTLDLTISSVSVSSGDTGDFTISALPTSPIAALDFSLFDIEFSPIAIGPRTAVIEILSNDSDEDPYTFTVTGNGLCVASAIVAEPSSGPEGTVVTVTGTNLTTATASFNGLAATVNNISASVMEVIVPPGASTGNLEILDDLGCPGTTPFTVIESQISNCEGSSGTVPTDLFISEVTDANTGGLTYIEIYNGTGTTINLASYSIQLFNNGSATQNGGSISLNNVNLATANTYIVAVSTGSNCTGIPGADGSLADQSGFGGINFVVNGDDHIRLYDGTTHLDSWGEYLSNTWADPLGIGSEGVVFRRNNTAGNLPDTAFNVADWTFVDWAACADNDYSNIGVYDFSTGTPPNITAQPNFTATNCDLTASISVTATEGFAGGNALAYQWYYSAPGDIGWTALSDNATYSGTSATTLNILNTIGLDDYQYYCQVREDDATCYTASNATRLVVQSTIWYDNSGTLEWSNGAPGISTIAVIDANYNTTTNGSFSACQLLVNATRLLTITDNFYVEVQNDLTVNGNILVESDGSFVQNNDSGLVDGAVLTDKTRITVEKRTALLNSPQEYTYWSSPVLGETIADGLNESAVQRRFWFNGQNFRDSTQETNNDDATLPGQDDIDDDANDWQFAAAGLTMLPGVGYAATHDAIGFIGVARYKYTFEGPFNNGVYNIPIYRNDAETADNNWNFIGNPYPSAIDADLFLSANASIDQTVGATSGAIFFWSHNTAAIGTTNGNEVLNYSQSDYAIINGTGETAGGDGFAPDRFIPSGQGFFVSMSDAATPTTNVGGMVESTNVIFNNSMRVTGNNAQFFRTTNDFTPNKIRLNLTSDNGVFNQILVGYVDGATNDDDGMYYDAHKNLSADANSLIYSLIDTNSDRKFAIQGKAPSSLSLDEVIPLGFYTAIEDATIYTISIVELEGEFMTQNTVYLRDYELNIVHDLSANVYAFTSETGEFNNRFEIVFQAETLSVTENEISPNDVSIIELGDGDVKISVGNSLIIKNVEILDMVGRTIYQLRGSASVEVYNLSRLSQAAYIARITLSNGQIITKKAIKRN